MPIIKVILITEEESTRHTFKICCGLKIDQVTYQIFLVEQLSKALEILREHQDIEIVIVDLSTTQNLQLYSVQDLTSEWPDIQVIVLDQEQNIQRIKSAMNQDAFDFILKPLSIEGILLTLNKAYNYLSRKKQKEQQVIQIKNKLLLNQNIDNLTGLINRNWALSA